MNQDGDMERVTARELKSGHTYDVVDADVYGGVWRLLDLGLVKLVRPRGLLLCSWPTTSIQLLNKETMQRLYGHQSIPSFTDFLAYMERACVDAGRKYLRGGPAPEKYGSIWRIPLVVL
jgi:hypothetical protein